MCSECWKELTTNYLNTAWKRGIVALTVCLIIAAVVLAVVLTRKSKTKDDSKLTVYKATCYLEDYTMWKPIKTHCNVSGQEGEDACIDVSRTSILLDKKVLPVYCSPQASDGTIICTGPALACQFRGVLTISFFKKAGNAVIDEAIKLSSPIYRMVTSVVQVFEQDGMNRTSIFNFTCALTSSCDTVMMALFVAGNRYLTEENATLCISTTIADGGYNKSCVFEIDEGVIRKQQSMDISCALLQDGGVAKEEKFILPRCSDRASDCNCSTKTTTCDEICSEVGTCLKHDPASRYQNITTEFPSCPILCIPKWCRDIYHFDKTITVTPEIIQAMCTKS
ncbi:hypothetical protein DPMN_134903 [Dreissena polymorpha]|uniref:Uncharacterized protein n=2 Tax=Dreissena polymorpha TaxID=45954 RepID=A0A9D4G0X8_DREPO|nr:hypothetical protein DPMN_134903 [Dreissena polymorpha]